MTPLLELTARSSAVLLAGFLAAAMLRRRSAALRHAVLAATLFAAAATGPLSLVVPSWDVQMTGSIAAEPAPEASRPDVELPAVSVTASAQPATSASVWTIAPAIWAAGFAMVLGGILVGCGRLVLIGARARPVADPQWQSIADELSARAGLRRPVTLLQTDVPGLLATWGALRPRVLLPSHARDWDNARLRVVLSHEVAHIRRHDWLVQIVAEIVRGVYWFNPLLWIACRRLRAESEQACDDAVLDAGVKPREYAAHLVEIARMCRPSRPEWVPAMLMARPSTLERRIAAMLNPDLNRSALSRRALLAIVVLALALTVPVAAFRAAQGSLPLTGVIYDSTGAVVPGVEVTLQDSQDFKWQATTDAGGRFEFVPVLPGKYVLEARIPGFQNARHEFELREPRDWTRVITLPIGELRETISVTARRGTAALQPAGGPQRLRVGGNIKAPRKVKHVSPVYPAAMRDAGLEGNVSLEAIIGTDGSVTSLRVAGAQAHPDFAHAAMEAARQWQFTPTLLNGQPVEVAMTINVRFALEN